MKYTHPDILNGSINQGDASYEIVDGVVEMDDTMLANSLGLKAAILGPTFEEYVKAGYQAVNYPPNGYPEIDSPGLRAFRAEEKAAAEEKARAASKSGKQR